MHVPNLLLMALEQIDITDLPQVKANNATLQTILTVVFTTTGAISLLIITIAGFRYVVSRGQSGEITKAKNAIVYALISLVISISAGVIVRFVIGEVT